MSNLNTPEKMNYKAFPLTSRLHQSSYDAISPSRAHVSQAGKTVMITGGSMGVGYAIAKAFAVADAHKIIIVGREQTKLKTSITKLREELGKDGATTQLEGMVCQISEPDSVEQLWDLLRSDGVHIDVLVLNAVLGGSGSLQELGWANVWAQFEVNVRSLHQFSDRFSQQSAPGGTTRYLINITSAAIHEWDMAVNLPSYSLTKHSAALLMQLLAREKDPAQIQIISFHPGAILTPNIKSSGMDENTLNWDDDSLPGAFAVWCATSHAAFLHGRFVWSAWDVDELMRGELRQRIEKDEKFLRLGVHGL